MENRYRIKFYVGLEVMQTRHFINGRCMVSINALRNRRSQIEVGEWILDSGAFTQITNHGRFLTTPMQYANLIRRWHHCGNMVAAVSQDYMCERPALEKTGLTIPDHQRLTIERYDAVRSHLPEHIYLMPVLQGYAPQEYVSHIRQYGDRLVHNQWVGVGSVCKRNANVIAIENVLRAIKVERPDLRLHGFGVKVTSLASSVVRSYIHSADSMAWSFSARRGYKEGRDRHSWKEAMAFVQKIENQRVY